MRPVYRIEQAVGMSACPVAECNYEWTTSTQLQRHFLYRHPEDLLHVIGEGEYVKCPNYSLIVTADVCWRVELNAHHSQLVTGRDKKLKFLMATPLSLKKLRD
jgi:hypothetical protein